MADVKIVVSAQDNASRVLAQVKSSLGDVQNVATRVGSVLGLMGIAGVAGLAQIVKSSIDSVDALNDVADATGATIENISALEDIAARTGTGMDTVTTALVKFNGILKDAKPGSAQEEIIKNIGLSAKELRDQDPAEALLEVAKALSQYEDDGKKARLVQELFGKSAKDLAPLLKDLAEKGRLVATVTTEQAVEAEKFNKELSALGKNVTDAGRYLTSDFVVGVNNAAKAMRESGLLEGVRTLLFGGDEYKNNKAIVDLTDKFLKAQNALDSSRASDQGGKSDRTKEAERRLALIKEELDLARGYQKVMESSGQSTSQKKPSAPDIPDTSGASAAKAAADKARKERERAAKEEQDLRIKLGRDLAIEQGKAVVDGNDAYAKAQEQQAKDTERYLEGIQKQIDAQAENNRSLADQVQEIGLTKEALNALQLQRQDDAIAQEEQTRATANAAGMSYEEIALLEQKIALLKQRRALTAESQIRQADADTRAEQKKASKEYADTLRGDLKGAFSAAFRDSSDPLQSFGDALADVIYSRAATSLAEALAESASAQLGGLFGGGSKGAGGLGGGVSDFLSSLFSFDGGGSTGSGARSGGLDGKGGFLSIMHPQETVLDHTKGQTSGPGQSVTVVQNFTVGDVASVSMVQKAVAGSERRIATAMGRSLQYGGALS